MKDSISLCVIAKNASLEFENLLNSAMPYVDELVVVQVERVMIILKKLLASIQTKYSHLSGVMISVLRAMNHLSMPHLIGYSGLILTISLLTGIFSMIWLLAYLLIYP